MKSFAQKVLLPFLRFRWRLALSYNLVTLAALFLLAWWGLVAGAIYLQGVYPTLSWQQVIQIHLLPAMKAILPSALVLVIPTVLVSALLGYLNARWLDIRLDNLRQAVLAWQVGDFSIKAQDDVADEIGMFGQSLNGMAGEMEHLLKARGELAALNERNHLARDLHDSVKQQITAASFQLAAAAALLERDPQAARASLAEAEQLNLTAGKELNAIILELRPVALKSSGLEQSLREYVAGWKRQTPIDVRLNCSWTKQPDPQIQQEVMRFVQEVLSNVARHSQATRVEISLNGSADELVLSILDNGRGFEVEAQAESGFGMRTMRERIQQVGGSFTLETNPRQGTRITARIPI